MIEYTNEIDITKGQYLVAYHGGGYSGCFWQWNYALIENNEFTDIMSSGYKGCKTYDALKEILDDSNTNIFNLELEDDKNEFVREFNEGHVLNVSKALLEHNIEILITCDECNEKFWSNEMLNSGYRGAGGIAIDVTGFICIDCYHSQCCRTCGEFYKDANDLDSEGNCPDCKKF